jgi:DNA-binding cell septation regulator SpoVG
LVTSNEEIEILVAAAKDGDIVVLEGQDGKFVAIGSRDFRDEKDRAVAAIWKR